MTLVCAACGTQNDGRLGACGSCTRPLALAAGSVLSGRYEVLSRLGEGGMGIVYRVLDRELDDVVALKLLRPEFSGADLAHRLKREVKLARRVSHANVCRLYEYGQHGGLTYVCMELVEGVDLRAIARPHGVPVLEARELLLQICQGLQAIHEVGIIHRDLKTANVMRDERGVVKLMDFGIAKAQGTGEETHTGLIIGTPEFMSPEQARGDEIDFRTDIYSVGVIAYELLTGRVPLRGNTPLATLLLVASEAPPLEGVIPDAFVPILARALAKHPQQRFATVRALAAALRLSETQDAAGPASALAATAKSAAPDTGSGPLAALVAADPSLPAEELIALATRQLEDPDALTRWRAAVTLWSFGAQAAGALDALRAATKDASEEVAEAAREAVSRIEDGIPDRPPHPDREEDEILVSDQLARLLEALRSQDPSTRWRGLLALGALGPAAAPALEAIADCVEDRDEQVACAATAALGRLGPAASSAVSVLAAASRSSNSPARRAAAANALREVGPSAHAAVPALIDLLASTEEPVADAAVEALAAVGPGAVPALLEALADAEAPVRWRSALLLTRIGFTPPAVAANR